MMADRTSQILAYVLDNLQVVSYKWLSRKFSISANEAKRLLQVVAEQHGSNLDIIYAVSGLSKADCHCHSVKLVPKSKLQEARDLLDGHISIHVYSIQPCIPKDPAELWSAEYVQSEELFNQPSELINCLRDNRFSAVSCSSVTRKVIGTSSTGNARIGAPKVTGLSTNTMKVVAPSTSATKVAAPSTSPLQPSTVQAEVLAPPASTARQSKQDAPGNSLIDTGNSLIDTGTVSKGSGTLAGPGNKGAAATKKKTAGSGDGSLANLWGRASTKSKSLQNEAQAAAAAAAADAANTGTTEVQEPVHEAQIGASSDDEDVANFARLRRGDVKSNNKRTRRMVVDDDISDEDPGDLEDENIVSLSSPEVPIEKPETSTLPRKNAKRLDVSVPHLNELKEDMLKDKKIKDGNEAFEADGQTGKPAQAVTNGASTAAPEPKKRKVLKTRMDERGREVTEVVWEVEKPVASDGKKEDGCLNSASAHGQVQVAAPPLEVPSLKSSAKASIAAVKNPANKAIGGKSTGKAVSKDAQQGRISTFFKKKN